MRPSFLALLSLFCLLIVTGCGAALAGQKVIETPTGTPSAATTAAPTPTAAPNASWQKLWTLPALPPPPAGTYGADPPYLPQITWSPANAQRLYLCRATTMYAGMPAVLHNLYRSDDQGQHWKAYPLPEAAANCYLEVDPTNADALVLQDNLSHSYVSRDGGQTWQAIPNPPQWDSSSGAPDVQIMAGKLYVESYWTTDLTHWTQWYPLAGDQQEVFVQMNPLHPQTLYTVVNSAEFACTGMPAALQLVAFETTLCRSDDGGQTWRFLTVVGLPLSGAPEFCLALNHPDTLYAWGLLNPWVANSPQGAMRSTDDGQSWSALPALFTGGSSNTNMPTCGAGAYAGQSPVRIDNAAQDINQWQNFGLTADGTIYHVVDVSGTQQGVTMSKGVSLLKGASWSVIAPYPTGLTTPDTNNELRMLLIAPPTGSPVLLGYTDQAVYAYPLAAS